MMNNYKGALINLNKAHEVEPNDAYILKSHGKLKQMWKDYKSALINFNKTYEIEPNMQLP